MKPPTELIPTVFSGDLADDDGAAPAAAGMWAAGMWEAYDAGWDGASCPNDFTGCYAQGASRADAARHAAADD